MKDERERRFEDELLDRALERHRVPEPDDGFEARMLAQIETERAPRRPGWQAIAAVALPVAAALIVAVVFLVRSPFGSHPPSVTARTIEGDAETATTPGSEQAIEGPVASPVESAAQTPEPQPMAVASETHGAATEPMRTAEAERARGPSSSDPGVGTPDAEGVNVAARSPTFPSRPTLSPQEALLVRLARRMPPSELRDLVAAPAPEEPLRVPELSSPKLRVEPLPPPKPLSSS